MASSPHVIGLLVGGLLPTIFFALSAVFAKGSNQAGIGLGIYLFLTGLAVSVVGIIAYLFLPDRTVSFSSGMQAFAMGATWGVGAASVALALTSFKIPLSTIVPLYNMNTLVAVLLGLWIFAEWKQVHVGQLIIGAVLIVIGGILVARA